MPAVPIIDGHNDTLTRIFDGDGGGIEAFLDGSDDGHLDLPRARAGGFAGGFFAIYVRADPDVTPSEPERNEHGHWTCTPPPITHDRGWPETLRLLDQLEALLEAAPDDLLLVRTIDDFDRVVAGEALGVILHIEGCEMISPDLHELDELYDRGLRSLGPVWSRPNVFGTGIRFGWPSTNDVGPGLTDAGKALVSACNGRGIMVDLSHLNRAGFMDVAQLSTSPLVATHCAAHALCESARNLDDEQLRIIAASGGVVGVNFYTGDLRGDGKWDADMPLSRLVDHVMYMLDIMGPDHVALGSDFDGATMCDELKDASGCGRVLECIADRGVAGPVIEQIAHANWRRVLSHTWH